jgi:hypothetical protein
VLRGVLIVEVLPQPQREYPIAAAVSRRDSADYSASCASFSSEVAACGPGRDGEGADVVGHEVADVVGDLELAADDERVVGPDDAVEVAVAR